MSALPVLHTSRRPLKPRLVALRGLLGNGFFFFFCHQILTFPKCLKRRETDAVSVMLSSVLPSKAKLCLFSMLFLLGSVHVNYVVHSQNPEKLSCLCLPFADLPAFSGAPLAQSTTKALLGLGICLVQEMLLPASSLGTGGVRSQGAFPSHMLCLSLYICW